MAASSINKIQLSDTFNQWRQAFNLSLDELVITQAELAQISNGSGDINASTVTANSFVGDGSSITNLSSGNLVGEISDSILPASISSDITGNAATATDASKLGGLNPSSFLRSDQSGSVSGDLTVTGDFVVNGTTTSVNSTVTTLNDPILTLADNATSTNDSKDRGIEFKYGDGSTVKTGFFGWDNTDSRFKFIDDGTNSSEVFSGSLGTIQSGSLISDGTIVAVGEVTAADFNTTSDVNLKENIQTTSGLSVIQQLRGVEYDLKESGKHQSGVIAQEVEEVLSHIVSEKEDGTKVVAYQQIIGHLIEAVKDLKAEIDELKK